jgi:hypothetical protein
MRAGLFALAALLILGQVASAQDEPLRQWTLGNAEISIESILLGDDHDLLTIRVDGNLMHAETAPHIGFVTPKKSDSDTPQLVPLTSTKAGDLVIERYSGGAHCCFSIVVVSLAGGTVVYDPPVEFGDDLVTLFRLPGKGQYGLRTSDYSYYHWTGEAEVPHPPLLLRYIPEKGGATLAIDLMKQPAPSAKRLEQMAAKMRDDPLWKATGISPDYLEAVLDLAYSGNLQSARIYALKAWPDEVTGRQKTIDDLFNCALPSSKWWPDIAALNGILPYKPREGCEP